ncbi:MAG: hypothetical protein HYZ27_02165, partial [Deltaproteobacteria bacterium]|nr:hypothetical protein [Deltaproteobacteria bacterium]
MTLLALCTLVASAAWADEVRLAAFPAERLEYAGADAPKGVVLLGARKKATLTVDGPATLTLRLFGLMDLRGKKARGPGAITVQVDREKPRRIELSRTKMDTWSIAGKPRWLPGAERRHVVTLGEGTHTLTLLPLRPAVLGLGLIVDVVRPLAATAEAVEPAEPPERPPEPPELVAPAE